MLQEYGKGPEGIQQLKHLASAFTASNRASFGKLDEKKEGGDDDDDIPELVENFESKLTSDEAAGASSSKEIVDWVTETEIKWSNHDGKKLLS